MGSLADELSTQAEVKSFCCAVARTIASITDEEDRVALARAVADVNYSANVIERLANKHGIGLNHNTIARHRARCLEEDA